MELGVAEVVPLLSEQTRSGEGVVGRRRVSAVLG